MLHRPFTFSYSIDGFEGSCFAVSVEQALDRAKVDYLKSFGIDTSSPTFRLEKSKLQSKTVKLSLKPAHIARYRELYRAFKDGDTSEREVKELEALQLILNHPGMK
jgi:hypothetical protein